MTDRKHLGLVAAGAIMLAGSIFLAMPTPATAQGYAYMTCGELWHARNAIYARKGYCFESRRAQRVFGPACFPPYGRLAAWEKRRVSQIRSWERRNGC